MSEAPIISVCVITYNHGKYIIQALESVLAQKCDWTFEVIVADDCSSDGTRDKIDQFVLFGGPLLPDYF